MKVINVPRYFAEEFAEWTHQKFIPDYDMTNTVWISIQEPGKGPSSNPTLDKIPNLKLDFADLWEPTRIYIVGKGYEMLNPATKKQAKQIVNFLVTHKGKNVIVNCAAGVSRSGSVAKFCEEYLGYEWHKFGKENHEIKNNLYDLMKDYFEKKYKSKELEILYGDKPLLTVDEIIKQKYGGV